MQDLANIRRTDRIIKPISPTVLKLQKSLAKTVNCRILLKNHKILKKNNNWYGPINWLKSASINWNWFCTPIPNTIKESEFIYTFSLIMLFIYLNMYYMFWQPSYTARFGWSRDFHQCQWQLSRVKKVVYQSRFGQSSFNEG